MVRRIRWQLVIALSGSLIVLFLLGSLALSTAATAVPPYSRVYVEGVAGVPRQLNPLLRVSDGPDSEADLQALLFDGLTRLGPDGTLQPDLAERWSINPGGTIYTFTLRSGLRWHDAAPLTAEDVLFTVRSVQHAGFAGDPGLAKFWRNVLAEQVDRYRVRFTLSMPFAPFLAATALPILPRHLLEDVPPERWATAPFGRRPVGTGPFRLQSLDETQAVLVPFEGAARGRPKLDLLVLRFYPSTDAAREALQRRDVQGVASVAMPGMEAIAPARHVRQTAMPLGEYTILTFNLREPQLQDERFRMALARGLDREELIRRVLGGHGRRLDTPVLPQTWARGSAALPQPEAEAAGRTLDALGWRRGPDGLRARDGTTLRLPLLAVDTPGQLALAREIARQWRTMGVDVPIEALSTGELQNRLEEHSFTLALHSWNAMGSDPDVFALWHSSQAEEGANYAGLSDNESDELLAQGRVTTNSEERARIYRAFEQRWIALVPSLPLYQPVLLYELDQSVRPAGVDGTRLLQTRSSRFDMISDWTVAR